MSLKQIVGQRTYSVWIAMLRQLVPEGRTYRLASLIAGMLQYTLDTAYQKYEHNPNEDPAIKAILSALEVEDTAKVENLSKLVEQLFADAKVSSERVNFQGDGYSIVEIAIYEFIHWYDMP